MALVDYSSSSESDQGGNSAGGSLPTEESDQPSKRRKSSGGVPILVPQAVPRPPVLPADCCDSSTNDEARSRNAKPDADRQKKGGSSLGQQNQAGKLTKSNLPPLPDEFYDLYASNVRTAAVDDPSLHQGRKRLTPHVPGNWPTHIYIEWHPSKEQHDGLLALVKAAQNEVGTQVKLISFLTSDLGAPLPLHISLSRPVVLETATKDDFLENLTGAVQHSKVHPFTFSARSLFWYASPDSNRKFLVLRVSATGNRTQKQGGDAGGSKNQNAPLVKLLKRCNTIVEFFGQPTLYAFHDGVNEGAFHVSIAWTFDELDEAKRMRTLGLLQTDDHAAIRSWEVDVAGIKAKIGNQVTHLALPTTGSGTKGPVKNLFC